MEHPNFRTSLLAVALLAAGILAGDARAQCPQPDNLDNGQCCQAVDANLPLFPEVSEAGLGICWKQCQVGDANDLKVELTAPIPGVCSEYKSTVTVSDSTSTAPLMVGTALLNYTRTWTEVGPNGQLIQVWRFVVKADLGPTPITPGVVPPCPVPTCLAPVGQFDSAFFYGYLDYARTCGQLQFENALVLFHGCDFLIHKPGLSSRPGVFHPDTSYAIVAPHSAANPFVPAAAPAPGGALLGEAVRNVKNPLGPFCTVEDKIQQGVQQPFANGCLCPLSTVPPQNTLTVLNGIASCPTPAVIPTFASQLIAFPILPWPHMVQTSIGSWTGSASYPGPEVAWTNEGLFRYHDSCTSQQSFEVFYGSTTTKGFPVLSTTPVILQTFTDLVDNWSTPASGPHSLPLMGHVFPSDHLIYTTTP